MEVSCPNCSQRLRYSDHLANPLLRCRNCLTTFRPAEIVTNEQLVDVEEVEEYESSKDIPFRRISAGTSQQPESAASSSGWFGRSGIGSLGVIGLLIAFKAGPRILREVFRERKPPPPVQIRHDERQAIEKMLKEAADNAAARQKHFQPLPVPGGPQQILPPNP